jgi:hypothetical protein
VTREATLVTSAPSRTEALGGRDSLVARVLAAPATWLVVIIGLSTLVRGWIVLRVPSPWILPDEVVYSELAKSIADGTRPAVRGVPVFGWGEVYPTLIAPAWALFDSPVRAYHAALAINALVMSSAAVPAYFLGRMFVARKAAILVAAMTVLVPSMAYTGVVMTENASYPVFLLAVLLVARAVRTPSIGNQALAFVGLGLMAFTRIQGIALVGAYLVAVVVYALTAPGSEKGAYLRRFVPTAVVAIVLCLAPVVASLVLGEGALGWLGTRSGTFHAFRPQEIPEWFVYLTGGLVLYVAVAPALATAIAAGQGLSRRASEHLRLFAAVGLPIFAAMLFSVSLVSASLDVDGTENLNERYVFYVVPLLFIGLAIWIESGLPRPRPWAWVIVAVGCVLPAIVPIDRLEYNAGFQSVALLPWVSLSLSGIGLAVLVGAYTVACGAVWLTSRRETAGRLWLLLATTMAFLGVVTYFSNERSASNLATAFPGGSATWVDDAVPAGATVAVLWDARAEGADFPGEAYFWLMATEVLNPTVGGVYRLGPDSYYEVFLPTVPVHVGTGRTLVDAHGTIVRSRYALVTCRTPVRGRVIAQAPRGLLRLVETDGAVRLVGPPTCDALAR